MSIENQFVVNNLIMNWWLIFMFIDNLSLQSILQQKYPIKFKLTKIDDFFGCEIIL